ncbi:hypothetical protein [Phenylobacterium sp.]|uniref:hypothetical protein n=1 Tax=Phenylobacterium sp. TaxID=1871053 RepID=UPI0028128143|nr:hypothetical protein [Phenylobacterium sp.]
MPDKHPNTDRYGGPGASHEDRTEPKPKPQQTRQKGEPTNTAFSGVSSGGGERDRHHSHDPDHKADRQQNSEQRAKHETPGRQTH